MKKLFIKITSILLFFLINNGVIIAQQLTLPQTNACINDTGLVAINFSNIDSIAALTLYVSYDTSVLTYAGFSNVNILTPGIMCGVPTSGPNAWQIVVSWVDNTLNGVNLVSGKLCDLKFKYKGGNSTLNFLSTSELVKPDLTNIIPSYSNGSISPAIITHPISKQICEDGQTSFLVTATSGSTYQWQIQNGLQWDNLQNNTIYSGVNANSLQILHSLYSLNNKNYRCIVSNTCPEYSNPALLTVYSKPIIVLSNDTTICNGNTLVINGSGTTGTAPLLFFWDQGLGSGITHTVSPMITTNYHLTVTDINSCSSFDSIIITVNQLPSIAGNITGFTSVCQGQNTVAYTVPSIANATSYIWSYSGSGASISGTTNSVTISFSSAATSGNLSVKGNNNCGDGLISANYPVTVNPLPANAGTITGTASVCQGQNTVAYTVPSIANATSYIWSYSGSGASITGTTNSVTISFSTTATSGNLSVKGNNSCGDGVISANYPVTVNLLPATAGTITGTASVCQGQNTVAYTVPSIANATSYVWSYSGSGASITGTTNSVTISFSTTATSGNLSVKGNNSCGDGVISANYPVTVSPLPADAAGIISFNNDSVSINEINVLYTVDTIAYASSYIWTYSGLGVSFVGGDTTATDSVRINFSTAATSGYLNVRGYNSCGDGIVSANYPIYVSTVDIDEITNSINCRIYPNPTKGIIKVEIVGLSEKSELLLYNLQGEEIYSESIYNDKKHFNKEINLKPFPKGIYFIKIVNNRFVKTQKIIVQ